MKRIISAILLCVLIVSICACGLTEIKIDKSNYSEYIKKQSPTVSIVDEYKVKGQLASQVHCADAAIWCDVTVKDPQKTDISYIKVKVTIKGDSADHWEFFDGGTTKTITLMKNSDSEFNSPTIFAHAEPLLGSVRPSLSSYDVSFEIVDIEGTYTKK